MWLWRVQIQSRIIPFCAVQSMSDLENGFYAKTNSAEIKTTLPCKITQSYSDVSNEVLLGLDLTTNALDKQKKIKQNI